MMSEKYHVMLSIRLSDYTYSVGMVPLYWWWPCVTRFRTITGYMICARAGPLLFVVDREDVPFNTRDYMEEDL